MGDKTENLLWLKEFNEKGLLDCLEERYNAEDKKIYTFIGYTILISINPYERLQCYSEENKKKIRDYFDQKYADPYSVKPPDAHIYYVVEDAYRDMMKNKKGQAFIISGESGSGKTESANYIIKYLTNSASDINVNIKISNFLLESFGNAKTARNNNSSRFGKFIEIYFSDKGEILYSHIIGYLLEKSRVTKIPKTDRNYHIFYQFILGSNEEEKKKYEILDTKCYNYLNNVEYSPDNPQDKELIDMYTENFSKTKQGFETLKFPEEEIDNIFKILIGILYLGNIQFVEEFKNNKSTSKIESNSLQFLEKASKFLGIEESNLKHILTEKIKLMGGEKYVTSFTKGEAENIRDGIAKELYSRMFNYLIEELNKRMENNTETLTSYSLISILDIFGFENFENNNSFEQLCINYANEKLQHYFNDHVINMELEEYKKEGINIEKINYEDNKEIIEYFDGNTETLNKKKISMFSLLESDDLIKMEPSKADKRFRNYVYTQLLKAYPNVLIEDKYNKHENKENFIIINHYAGKIVYNVVDMVQKNLSQLNSDIKVAFTNSSNGLIKRLFEQLSKENKNKGMDKILSDTLIRQFKKQIQELFRKIQDSNKIYVKCINPNNKKMPKNYDRTIISEQMKYLGILELIKIKQKGYNIHITKEDFQNEYKYLINGIKLNTTKTLENVIEYIKGLDEDNNPCKTAKVDLILVGKIDKIFMKEDFKQFLDYLLSKEEKKMIKIQAHERGRIERKKLYKLRTSVIKIQYAFRKMIKRVRNKSATKIQAHYRGLVERKKLKEIIKKVTRIQAQLRCFLKRKKLKDTIKKTIRIQAQLRCFVKRKKMKDKIKKAIRIQAQFRCLVKRKKLKDTIKKTIKIQSNIRRLKERNKLKKLTKIAIKIQKYVRGILAKKKVYRLRKIIKIQKCIKGRNQRIKLRNLRKKAIKIQSYVRGRKERIEVDKLMKEKKEKERLEKERIENERLEKMDKEERERIKKEKEENERKEKERKEKERIEKEKKEKEKKEKEEKERIEKEKEENERKEKERIENERIENEKMEKKKQEKEEKEKMEKDKQEKERIENEKKEKEKMEKEKQGKEKQEKEKQEKEKMEKEKQDKERIEKEKENERIEKEKKEKEKERIEKEKEKEKLNSTKTDNNDNIEVKNKEQLKINGDIGIKQVEKKENKTNDNEIKKKVKIQADETKTIEKKEKETLKKIDEKKEPSVQNAKTLPEKNNVKDKKETVTPANDKKAKTIKSNTTKKIENENNKRKKGNQDKTFDFVYLVNDVPSEIDIFGETFVKRNKEICYLLFNGKSYKLTSKFTFLTKGENTITLVVEEDDLRLKGMFCFFDVSGKTEEDYCYNITEDEDEENLLIDASSLEHLDVSLCTDLSFMFYNCKKLQNFDFLKGWDVTKNKNFNNMFTFCNFSHVNFLSKWKMKNAQSFEYMFWGCENLKDLTGIQNWKLENAKLFGRMFANCKNLTDVNALQYWNMTKAIDISYMFENCIKLVKMESLNNWKLDNKVDKKNIIYQCKSIKNIPDIFKNTSDKSDCLIF